MAEAVDSYKRLQARLLRMQEKKQVRYGQGYAETGYDPPVHGVVLADWGKPSMMKFARELEDCGWATEWAAEWDLCAMCTCAVRTRSGGELGWEPVYLRYVDATLCRWCIEAQGGPGPLISSIVEMAKDGCPVLPGWVVPDNEWALVCRSPFASSIQTVADFLYSSDVSCFLRMDRQSLRQEFSLFVMRYELERLKPFRRQDASGVWYEFPSDLQAPFLNPSLYFDGVRTALFRLQALKDEGVTGRVYLCVDLDTGKVWTYPTPPPVLPYIRYDDSCMDFDEAVELFEEDDMEDDYS